MAIVLAPSLPERVLVSEILIVLQSFPDPRPTTNPYIVMLGTALSTTHGLRVRTFTWRTALLGRYDVFHVHWPEILVSGHGRLKKAVRQLLFVLLLVRLKLSRKPLVRTVHNLELPKGISRVEVALLRLAERWTAVRIAINKSATIDPEQTSEVILHGHYRDWFGSYPQSEPIAGRLAYFGLIRRYKGVDTLISAFRSTAADHPDWTLHIAGHPSSQELVDELTELAGTDERISLSFRFLSDSELVHEVGQAQLVVLPYREMHNSGGALTALSIDRPIAVPDNVANRLLGEEVGMDWVLTYPGIINDADLDRMLTSAAVLSGSGRRPDLSHRDWEGVGLEYLAAYQRAVESTHRRRDGHQARRAR